MFHILKSSSSSFSLCSKSVPKYVFRTEGAYKMLVSLQLDTFYDSFFFTYLNLFF